jgi:hypothetical protein
VETFTLMAAEPENVSMALGACQQEAAGQVATAGALDAKLMGLLGFMAAATGLLLSVPHGLASNRWILLAGSGSSIVIALLGLIFAEDPRSGPNPVAFYNEFGGATQIEFRAQLLADTGHTVGLNGDLIEERRVVLSAAFALAVLAGVAFGLVRALA